MDHVLGVVRRGHPGAERGVCGGGRARPVHPGGGVEVHTLAPARHQADLQRLRLPPVEGHGVVPGKPQPCPNTKDTWSHCLTVS